VAVIFGVAAGSAGAVHLIPSASEAVPDVFYPLHVKFNVTCHVEWAEASGDEPAQCQSWRRNRGVTTVVAQDTLWKRSWERRPRRHGVPGSLKILRALRWWPRVRRLGAEGHCRLGEGNRAAQVGTERNHQLDTRVRCYRAPALAADPVRLR
jgi:hypothetical protein